jgi:hypothetical protein
LSGLSGFLTGLRKRAQKILIGQGDAANILASQDGVAEGAKPDKPAKNLRFTTRADDQQAGQGG